MVVVRTGSEPMMSPLRLHVIDRGLSPLVTARGLNFQLLVLALAGKLALKRWQFLLALSVHCSILIQVHHVLIKITANINSGGDFKCIMDVLPICALLLGQTEDILGKSCVFAQSEGYFWLTL